MTLPQKLSTFAVLMTTFFASADPLSLASPFSDHAVLQRGVEAPVWGRAEPGDVVTLAIKKDGRAVCQSSVTADSEGKWRTVTKVFEAGGPYGLEALRRPGCGLHGMTIRRATL